MLPRPLLCSVLLSASWIGTGCGPAAAPPPNEQATENVDNNLRLVGSGINTPLNFKADHAGVIRVYDFQKGDYLYSGPLKAGDQFTLNPEADYATLNKQPVFLDHATNRYDEYRLYFMTH